SITYAPVHEAPVSAEAFCAATAASTEPAAISATASAAPRRLLSRVGMVLLDVRSIQRIWGTLARQRSTSLPHVAEEHNPVRRPFVGLLSPGLCQGGIDAWATGDHACSPAQRWSARHSAGWRWPRWRVPPPSPTGRGARTSSTPPPALSA